MAAHQSQALKSQYIIMNKIITNIINDRQGSYETQLTPRGETKMSCTLYHFFCE